MNNKIPCGGFYLNDTLGVDENGKLGVNGGEPYKSLVTDGDGNAKWEDRLAYESGSRLVVPLGDTAQLVKVADEVPSWVSMDASIKIWTNNGKIITITPEDYTDLGNGSFVGSEYVSFITTDNFEFNGVVYPEKGVYFAKFLEGYTMGIASADSDAPEITWDGNISAIKKIDEKFIPDIPAEKLPDIPAEKLPDIPAHVIEVNGDFYASIENASQPSYNAKNLNYSEILSIFNSKNFVIKDNNAYYRPIGFGILTSGDLSVTILVTNTNGSDNMVVANLVCTNGQSRFYRNSYCTIVVTRH